MIPVLSVTRQLQLDPRLHPFEQVVIERARFDYICGGHVLTADLAFIELIRTYIARRPPDVLRGLISANFRWPVQNCLDETESAGLPSTHVE